jgi:hypothetical protein
VAHTPADRSRSGTRVTRLTAALVVVTTAAVVGLLLRAFPTAVGPTVVGATGAVLLVLAVRLSTTLDRVGAGVGGGLLAAPAGAGVVGGVALLTVLLVEDIFPVESEALLSVGWLEILGQVSVVAGCSVAVLGATLTVRRWEPRSELRTATGVVVGSGVVPAVTAFAFLLVVQAGGNPERAVVEPIGGFIGTLLAPATEVLPESLVLVSALAVLAGLLTVGVGRLPGVFTPGRRVTGAIVGGTVTTVGVVVIAEWVYQQITAELLRRFPMEIEDGVRDLSRTVADSFGESTVLVLAVLVCVGVTTVLLLGLRLALWSGLLSGTSPGTGLAAGGLFFALAFGATVGAPAWLVVGGVAVCLLVRDAGQFGATLVREMGVGRARRVEFVHLTGTVLVGLGAAALALVVVDRLPAPTGTATGTDLLALASLVVGLASLALALAVR